MGTESRNRVLAAIEHRQPDQGDQGRRVPIDFGGHRSSGIMAIAYRKLREHLGLPKREIRVYDMIQQLAVIDEDVLDRFGVDTIEIGRGFCRDSSFWRPWKLPDGTECVIPRWVDVRRDGEDWLIYSPPLPPLPQQQGDGGAEEGVAVFRADPLAVSRGGAG